MIQITSSNGSLESLFFNKDPSCSSLSEEDIKTSKVVKPLLINTFQASPGSLIKSHRHNQLYNGIASFFGSSALANVSSSEEVGFEDKYPFPTSIPRIKNPFPQSTLVTPQFFYYEDYTSKFINIHKDFLSFLIRVGPSLRFEFEADNTLSFYFRDEYGARINVRLLTGLEKYSSLFPYLEWLEQVADWQLAYYKDLLDRNYECIRSNRPTISTANSIPKIEQDVSSTYPKIIGEIKNLKYEIQQAYLDIYNRWMKEYPNPFIAWERGFLLSKNGQYFDAYQDISYILAQNADNLSSKDLLDYGTIFTDIGKNDEALQLLTKSIEKDPYNFTAYFERSCIHFELGNIDLAIEDYKKSEVNDKPIEVGEDESSRATLAFTTGLIKGLGSGFTTSLKDFVPSMLCSLSGLGHGLWALCTSPKEVSLNFVNSVRSCVQFLKEHTAEEMFQYLAPELKELVEKWNGLSEFQKGELIGSVIGRHGTDMFLFSGVNKGYAAFRSLKKANAAMTLKAISESPLTKKAVLSSTKEWNSVTLGHLKFIKDNKIDKQIYKNFAKENLKRKMSETEVRKIIHNTGIVTFERPSNVPLHWDVKITQRGLGMQYVNPIDPGDYVRVMPGNPNSINSWQKKPYIIRMKDGKAIDKIGNPVDRKLFEAHIPLDEFIFIIK